MSDSLTSAMPRKDRTAPVDQGGSPDRLRRGTAIDRYVVIDRLGTGGMGDVYSAWDEELRRRVALKVIRSRAGAQRRAMMLQEARALARLRHPHVVSVHDVGEEGGAVFVAMDLLQGEDLRAWAPAGPETPEVVDVVLQCARGLAAAHADGVVHHDVKPANVMIESRGGRAWAMLIDFGLAANRAAETASTVEGGTRAYMAPERAVGEPGGPASDQWSLALLTVELLSGTRPTPTDAVAGSIGPCGAFAPVLRRALRAEPGERFEDVETFAAALERVRRPAGRRRGARLVIGAAVLGAAVWVGDGAAPTCQERTSAWLNAHLPADRVEAALQGVRAEAPGVAAPIERQVQAWRNAWAEELATACGQGRPPAATCRDVQVESLVATLNAAASTTTSLEGGWALLAAVAHLVQPCSPGAPSTPPELAEVRALAVAQRFDEAFEAGQSLLDSLSSGDPSRARLTSLMADIQMKRGEPDAALRLADEAMMLAAQSNDRRSMARTAVGRVSTLMGQGRFAEAQDAARVARPLVAAADDPPDLLTGLLTARGRVHEVRFELTEALADFEAGLEIAARTAQGSLQEASMQAASAEVMARQGRCEEAEPRALTAIGTFVRRVGKGSPHEAQAMFTLSTCAVAAGKLEEAAKMLGASAAMYEQALGPDDYGRGHMLTEQGDLLDAMGQRKEANALYREAVRIMHVSLGPDHRETVIASMHVGWHMLSLGETDAARPYIEGALSKAQGIEGLDDVEHAQLEGARAALHEADGELLQALAAQQRSVEHLRVGMAGIPANLVRPMMNLALLHARTGASEEARAVYAEARAIATREPNMETLVETIDAALDEF